MTKNLVKSRLNLQSLYYCFVALPNGHSQTPDLRYESNVDMLMRILILRIAFRHRTSQLYLSAFGLSLCRISGVPPVEVHIGFTTLRMGDSFFSPTTLSALSLGFRPRGGGFSL